MDKTLIKKMAISAASNAYSPYSNFNVGAVLVTANGKMFCGNNIENSSYSATVCAERVAFFKAISEGESNFECLVIAALKNGKITRVTPCGICRQVITEFCQSDFKILCVTEDGFEEYTLSQLLPNAFTLKEENI